MTSENINDESTEMDEQPIPEEYKLSKENFPDVKTNLLYFIQVMSNNAYIYLGLVPIPGTEDTVFDLEQAKQSIDFIETMFNFGKPHFDDRTKKEFEDLLSQLQMNYVSKSQSEQKPDDEKTEQNEKSGND